MKKVLGYLLAGAVTLGSTSVALAAENPFSDVPPDHWSQEAVSQLAHEGIIEGYAVDGTFKGDQTMTRYEMAQLVAKAMAKAETVDNNTKATIDRLSTEYSDELANLGVRLADLENKFDNFQTTGVIRYQWDHSNFANSDKHREPETNTLLLQLNSAHRVNEHWTGRSRIEYKINNDDGAPAKSARVPHLYALGQYDKFDIMLGRLPHYTRVPYGMIMDIGATGAEAHYAPDENWHFRATATRTALSSELASGAGGKGESTYLAGAVEYYKDKWSAAVTYHRLMATNTYQANEPRTFFQVASVGTVYAFDKNVRLTAGYAIGPKLTNDRIIAGTNSAFSNAPRDAYNIQIDYKGPDLQKKGSFGLVLTYRQLSPFVNLGATYNIGAGRAGLTSLKGWEIGGFYVPEKNIMASLRYFKGRDTMEAGDNKVSAVWGRFEFFF